MTTGPNTAVPVFALSPSATAAGAAVYRAETATRAMEPCSMHLAQRRPAEGRSVVSPDVV